MNFNPTGDSWCKTHGWLRCTCSPEPKVPTNYVHVDMKQDPNSVWQYNSDYNPSGKYAETFTPCGHPIIANAYGPKIPTEIACSGMWSPGMKLTYKPDAEDLLEEMNIQRLVAERRLRFLPKFIRNWLLGM